MTDHETTLIQALRSHGILITPLDVPEVVRMGADEFISKKGKVIKPEDMTGIHLILQEIRSGSSP